MTTLCFVRHGESRANVDKVFTGQTDVPLSDRGLRQAEELKERLLALKPDAFFSSDLLRAVQTVTPAAKALGLAVRPEKGLREIDGGLWEGKHIDEIARAYPKDYACWMEDIGGARAGSRFAHRQRERRKSSRPCDTRRDDPRPHLRLPRAAALRNAAHPLCPQRLSERSSL